MMTYCQIWDLPGFTPDTSRAARGGRKRGTGSKRILTRNPAMSTTSNVHSDGDRFEELTIDEDVVFVECPLCLQMFPK
ncbi:hypothetical protein BaRGS_00037970 [Batillaria attramentaria]|uniref:Uncharacterized protein n=1 Tax=Batillaria attramentaria TaxID=370345 RepID=A0ABD0J7D5_9CAEN